MPNPSISGAIQDWLSGLEAAENVKVLYAVESGSRAWGFASPDSDYDIRFVYIRPAEWYLSVRTRRDVIEAMTDPDLDFAGWDLQKALLLLRKSNPSLIEWMGSPIVYKEDPEFMAQFRDLASRCTSLHACLRHYLHTAESNWKAYFDSDSVKLKKYFYVLRPIFACRWIEQHQTVPPVLFQSLLDGAGETGAVEAELEDLLLAKSQISELGVAPRRPILDKFLVQEMSRIRDLKMASFAPVDYQVLDEFFRWSLSRTDEQ